MAAIIEGVCGVSEDEMSKDYELSSFTPTRSQDTPHDITGINGRWRYYDKHGYKDMVEYIKSMTGDTQQDKWQTWLRGCGVTQAEIDEFISIVVA